MRLSQEELAEEIKRYCILNPDASDTLEGIAWWVAHQQYHEMLTTLEAAVERLVDERLLERHEMPDGTTLYSCQVAGRNSAYR